MTVQKPPAWLVPPGDLRLLSPNRYHDRYKAYNVKPVETMLIHYTAGYSGEGSAKWLANKIRKADGTTHRSAASAHFVVTRAGKVIQLVPLTDRAWHAGSPRGTSRWRGKLVNARSIGIEVANLGPMKEDRGRLVDVWGRVFNGEAYTDADGRQWEAYPAAQVAAVHWLCGLICHVFPILRVRDEQPGELPRICGHQDVDPSRKIDPGPAWDMDALRQAVETI